MCLIVASFEVINSKFESFQMHKYLINYAFFLWTCFASKYDFDRTMTHLLNFTSILEKTLIITRIKPKLLISNPSVHSYSICPMVYIEN